MSELENLIDARKKIDARIKELQNANRYKFYNNVRLTKGEGGRTPYYKSIYRLKIRKHSDAVETEHNRFKTIIEDPDLEIVYLYLKQIAMNINDCLNDIEIALRERKNENSNQNTV